MKSDSTQAQIRAQWSINAAIALMGGHVMKLIDNIPKVSEKDLYIAMTAIEDSASYFYEMVDRLVAKGSKVPEKPATEPQIKYLKSLLRQKGASAEDKVIQEYLKHEVSSENVSQLIDALVKGNVPSDFYGDKIRGADDGEVPEKEPKVYDGDPSIPFEDTK